jgi:hypothetical protein
MAVTQQSRRVDDRTWKSHQVIYNAVQPGFSGKIPKEVQMIFTEDHPGWKRSDGQRDTGGAFESYKVEILNPGIPWTSRYLYGNYGFPVKQGWNTETSTFLVASSEVAQLFTQMNALETPEQFASYLSNPVRCPQGPSSITMDAMGTKAIDMVKPTNPTVDLATSLAELWSERKFFSVPGKTGDPAGEYLNYQFGIAPTLSDFQDLRKAIEHGDAIIRQYERDAGSVIRREYRFEPESVTTRSEQSLSVFGLGHGLSFNQCPGGRLIKRTTTNQKFWFAGAFKYSIPKGAFPERLAELDRRYGVVPGISTGWELVPFSWAVDYFTPIGSLLSNLDAFMKDGLVLPYAYLMSTTEVVDEYDWLGNIRNDAGALVPVGVYSAVKKTRLRRRHATPFGFGLLASDLSPKQLSILAALGLTLRK